MSANELATALFTAAAFGTLLVWLLNVLFSEDR